MIEPIRHKQQSSRWLTAVGKPWGGVTIYRSASACPLQHWIRRHSRTACYRLSTDSWPLPCTFLQPLVWSAWRHSVPARQVRLEELPLNYVQKNWRCVLVLWAYILLDSLVPVQFFLCLDKVIRAKNYQRAPCMLLITNKHAIGSTLNPLEPFILDPQLQADA